MTAKGMATTTAIDGIGGIIGVKEKMTKMREAIKEENEKADSLERENAEAKRKLCKALGEQQGVKQNIEKAKNDMERLGGKMKYIESRVTEKEEFVRESKGFNDSLKIAAVREEEIEEAKKKVKIYTDAYNKNQKEYATSKRTKMNLEQRYETIEYKRHDLERRLNALTIELEYNLVEEGRKSQVNKYTTETAFKAEKGCLDLQRKMDVVMKRKGDASKKVIQLESQVHKLEDSLEAMNFERRKTEAMIREILLSRSSCNT